MSAKPGIWPKGLNKPAVPLSKIQIDILGLLVSQRDPESYLAGAAMKDGATLEDAGYQVSWLRQLPAVYAAEVTRYDGATRLER